MKQAELILELDKVLEELLHDTACSLGKDHIHAMKQATDLELLNIELAKTDEAYRLYQAYGPVGLGGLHDMSSQLSKASMDGMMYPEEFLNLLGHIDCCHTVMHYRDENRLDTPHFHELTSGLIEHKDLKREIELCIDQSGEISDRASPELFKIRRQIHSTENQIRTKMNSYLVSEKDHLSEAIVTSRNDRFVIPVKMTHTSNVRGIVHAQSASHQTAYIEPEAVVLLNNQLQMLHSQEQDEIERILRRLTGLVKAVAYQIQDNQDILGELDFLFAKAMYGARHDCVCPVITEDFSHLLLKKARHPLIDRQKVVANTIEMEKPVHVMLITGSNTGGKTVNLKTTGLLSLMALYGMLVPCTEAIIPFFDCIFVDLGDEQSIEQSLSTFSSHMSRLVDIVDHVTPFSLVLIDEVGSGTDPLEGQSLAQALIEHLHALSSYTIATTHYSSLKRFAKTTDYMLLASVAFDEEAFAPTYHLILGESGKSYAMAISKRLGLNERLIARANEIKAENQTENEKLIERLETEMEKARLLQEEYEAKVKDTKKLEERWLHRQEVFDRERQRYIDEAQKQANDLVEEAKGELSRILAEFKEKGKNVKQNEINDTRHEIEKLHKEKEVPVIKGDAKYPFEVGDTVRIFSMNRNGEVVEIKKNELVIMMGGMRTTLKKDQVGFVSHKAKAKKVVATRGATPKKTGHYEVNVIGMRYDEAMQVVDKFIDDALMIGYPSCRIIHGMGTGALRKGVHQLLKKHKRVKSFSDGGPNEGGLGATIAYFE